MYSTENFLNFVLQFLSPFWQQLDLTVIMYFTAMTSLVSLRRLLTVDTWSITIRCVLPMWAVPVQVLQPYRFQGPCIACIVSNLSSLLERVTAQIK